MRNISKRRKFAFVMALILFVSSFASAPLSVDAREIDENELKERNEFYATMVEQHVTTPSAITVLEPPSEEEHELLPLMVPIGNIVESIEFAYNFHEITVAGSASIAPIRISEFRLAENTGLSSMTLVRAEWWRTGATWATSTAQTSLGMMGINPLDPFSLASAPTWSWSPSLFPQSQAGSNTYVLRIFFGNIVVAESDPIYVVTDPNTPVDPNQLTAQFVYGELGQVANVGDRFTFGWPAPVQFRFVLDADTGFIAESPLGTFRTEWRKDGEFFSSTSISGGTLQSWGIAPDNPSQLEGWLFTPPFTIDSVTEDHAGQYTLRVYMGGQAFWNTSEERIDWTGSTLLGESEPFELIVNSRMTPELSMVNVDFDHRFSQINASEGEARPGWSFIPAYFYVSLEGTDTGLSNFTPVEWRWVRDGNQTVHASGRQTLQNWGIQPNNPQALTTRITTRWRNDTIWQVNMSDAGEYRLHVYIADERIAISEPIIVYVVPDPALASMSVSFESSFTELAVANNEWTGIRTPISAINIDLVSVAATTTIGINSTVRLEWWKEGATQASRSSSHSLSSLGIDPRNSNALTASVQPPQFPVSNIFANEAMSGAYALRVIMLDRLVAESEPISVSVVPWLLPATPPTISQLNVIFNISPDHLLFEEGQNEQVWGLADFALELAPNTRLSPYVPFVVRAEWFKNGQEIAGAAPFQTELTLDDIGINPANSSLLKSIQFWPEFPVDFSPAVVSQSGEYSLHIFVDGELLAVSDTVLVEVVPWRLPVSPPASSQLSVLFGDIVSYVSATVGDNLDLDKAQSFAIRLSSDTRLSPFVPFSIRASWYKNGSALGNAASFEEIFELHELGINPADENALEGRWLELDFPSLLSPAIIEDSGSYTLRIFINGVLIGESGAIVVNVVPVPPNDVIILGGGLGYNATPNPAEQGEVVILNAGNAPAGHRFAGWDSDDVIIINPLQQNGASFVMQDVDVAVIANWEEIPPEVFTITIIDAGVGYGASPNPAEQGEIITLNAGTPPISQRFVEWTSEHVAITNATYQSGATFVMIGADVVVTAIWEDIPLQLFNVTIVGGGVGYGATPSIAEQGVSISLDAGEAPSGKRFVNWHSEHVAIINPTQQVGATLVMPSTNIVVIANWEYIPPETHAIILIGGGEGSGATPNPAAEGEIITLNAGSAPIGQRFVGWTSDEVYITNPTMQSGAIFAMVGSAVYVTAVWEDIPHVEPIFDVEFIYPNFFNRSVRADEPLNFRIIITPTTDIPDFLAVDVEWLHNGMRFVMPPGYRNIHPRISVASGTTFSVDVVIPGRGDLDRAGYWSLRVTPVDVLGRNFPALAVESDRRVRVTSLPPLGQTSPPNSGGNQNQQNRPDQPDQPTQPPTPKTHAENTVEIRNQLEEEPESVTLALEYGVDEVQLFGSAISFLIDAGTDLIVQTYEGTSVTIPVSVLQEMMDRAYPFAPTGNFSIVLRDLTDIYEAASESENHVVLAHKALSVSINGAEIARLNESLTISTDIGHMVRTYLNTNYFRITAIDAYGNNIGGEYDPETGLFTFNTYDTGYFTIQYVWELRRLNLILGTPVIFDLARPGKHFELMDVIPIIQEGRTLIPIRFVAEALGFEVLWNSVTSEVTLVGDELALTFAIGETLYGMDVPAQIINSRTMLPLRFVAEYFGATVSFDEETRTIEIVK